jgi:hypothetical protein
MSLQRGYTTTCDRLRHLGGGSTDSEAAMRADRYEGFASRNKIHDMRLCRFGMDRHILVLDSIEAG